MSLKGMVIRCSSIIPEIREAVFRCIVCGHFSEPIVVDRGNFLTPTSYIGTVVYNIDAINKWIECSLFSNI